MFFCTAKVQKIIDKLWSITAIRFKKNNNFT